MLPFTRLAIWSRGEDLTIAVYRLTKSFPPEEKYTLTSQLRRAALFVPTNIAEGSGRRHAPDFARFLNIAEGSLAELQSLLRISSRLGYVAPAEVAPLSREAEELAAMVFVFRRRVQERKEKGPGTEEEDVPPPAT